MGGLGTWEILLIFLVVLLVFGAKRIPEIARGLGKGIREFKDATTEIKNELNVDDNRQRINNPRPPQQGTTAARSESTPESSQQAAPQTASRPAASAPAESTAASDRSEDDRRNG